MSRRLMSVALLAIVLALPGRVLAQPATPGPAAGGLLDLAAMALSPDDVPDGYFDESSEWLVPAAAMVDLLGVPHTPTGLARLYQTFYASPQDGTSIHVFVLEFGSPDQATEGAGVVDGILRPPLPEGSTLGPTHVPGPAIGEEPRALTTVTYNTWAAGGPRVDVVAASFRRDRLIAGISIERYADPPEKGTPAADNGTAVAADPAQESLAADLAEALDGRIVDVLAGRAPTGVDFALADALLPIEQLVGASIPAFGGYKSGIDLLRCGVCGEENTLVPFADRARGGVTRGVAAGPLVDGEPQPPFVSIAISAFVSPEDALAVLEAIRQAPNDRPTAIPVPRGAKALVADPLIPGASAALAFHAVFGSDDPNAAPDSAGVDFVVDARLVTIDVQGGLPADATLAAAVDLATQQAACLTAGGVCAGVVPPAALVNTAGA